MNFLKNIINADNRHMSMILKLAKKIDALQDEMKMASDDELKKYIINAQSNYLLKGTFSDNDIINVFASVREVDNRIVHQFPYFVQVVGALVLYYGDIAEMKTGEGKTLTSTMAVVLRAIEGKGVHVVTTNDYLSLRDYENLRGVYEFYNFRVGLNRSNLPPAYKKAIFACDIVYTTNAELGFDYLRDGFIHHKENRVINKMYYAIIDEVDSILIDEARTPLIIAGEGAEDFEMFRKAQRCVENLHKGDVEIDNETKSAYLSEQGIANVEKYYGVNNLYMPENMSTVHVVNQALKANYIFFKDKDYVVKDNQIFIVDIYTGRILEGREYSEGLHQAIQAKEDVEIKSENKTVATITYQNYFRLYDLLAGMSGTAKSEEEELFQTYNMRVFEISTNRPNILKTKSDAIFNTKREKIDAIVQDTINFLNNKQPVLIGTSNINDSVILSKEFEKKHISHVVLNGTQDISEADIVAQAGSFGTLTIATNIAGRGTDIPLETGVNEIGGLCVLGFERFDAKRIDNQLKGRCGRQGDNGYARMYVSLDDKLFIEHANELQKEKLLKTKGEKLQNLVDLIQKQAEVNHYDSRKQMLKYEEDMRIQRQIVMENRESILDNKTGFIVNKAFEKMIDNLCYENDLNIKNESDYLRIVDHINQMIKPQVFKINMTDYRNENDFIRNIIISLNEIINNKCSFAISDDFKKEMCLDVIDIYWQEHVDLMMHLKSGIHLRSRASEDPALAFKKEGYELFEKMFDVVYLKISEELIGFINLEVEESQISSFLYHV